MVKMRLRKDEKTRKVLTFNDKRLLLYKLSKFNKCDLKHMGYVQSVFINGKKLSIHNLLYLLINT